VAPPEVWLRGPLEGIPPLLQPVAHSLLQCREEVLRGLADISADQLERRIGGAASAGYHIRHAIGSLDRLFSYARGDMLTPAQLAALREEHDPNAASTADELATEFDAAVDRALTQVASTPESTLTEERLVGRARLPSTVIGLLFHAAEHTQRHVGQFTTTVKIIRALA